MERMNGSKISVNRVRSVQIVRSVHEYRYYKKKSVAIKNILSLTFVNIQT